MKYTAFTNVRSRSSLVSENVTCTASPLVVWTADIAGGPVGFICVWELAVGEPYQHQDIGWRLMARIESQARDAGAGELSLTTFADVPWNGPFYASRGFEVIDPEACSPRLQRILELEVRSGMPGDRRCAMRLRL
jgi:N-acetylglutamate synthase-like GNAT family acetyltransferase